MECDYLNGRIKNGHLHKNHTKIGESKRYSWGMQKKKKKKKKKNADNNLHILLMQGSPRLFIFLSP